MSQKQTVSKGSLILVTGVTGFIASHAAEQLLEAGYKVRGTARDPKSDKAEHLIKRFQSYGDKFEVVEASDLVKDGVFDEAVKGVDGILHIASPFFNNATDAFKQLIDPAVKGTTNLLKAANGSPSVKHVVVTSSVASVLAPKPQDTKNNTYTEADWNDDAVENIHKDPSQLQYAYRASKNAAERFAWKYAKDNNVHFGLTCINPPLVFGPVIHKIKDVDSINTSVALLFKFFSQPDAEIPDPMPAQSFVDVRDVAKAHILSLEKPEASGERFITSGGQLTWGEAVEHLRAIYPDRDISKKGPGYGKSEPSAYMSAQKSKDVLGMQYIDARTSIKETIDSLKSFW